MERRTFVISALAGLGALSIPAWYYFKDVEYDTKLAKPESLSLIWDAETISSMGNQYRANNAEDSRVRLLVNALESAEERGLIESIANDFKTRNTVVVDGWILSITEARQCALASTIDSKS